MLWRSATPADLELTAGKGIACRGVVSGKVYELSGIGGSQTLWYDRQQTRHLLEFSWPGTDGISVEAQIKSEAQRSNRKLSTAS